MTTKIAVWGNSLGIRLPKSIIDNLNLSNGSELNLSLGRNGSIVLEPVDKIPSLKELLRNANPKNRHSEFWTDKLHGQEIW